MKLQLTLRDLFWLMLLAALLVNWRIDHSRRSEELVFLEEKSTEFKAKQAALEAAKADLLLEMKARQQMGGGLTAKSEVSVNETLLPYVP